MAFQRPFLISLKRQDSQFRWGFGINGGKDYDEPIRVQTVGEDSLAEQHGLREGDEIIQVGRVNVQDLTLGQVYELLARCGNKIEMFVIREDLLTGRKGKEPPVVKAVVHNPYNSPLSLYSTENIADTLAKQTEVLTEGHVSAEEDEGPESLSFKQKSAVFQLLEEQAKQEGVPGARSTQSAPVKKPKAPPPPPPKPKAPAHEHLSNGYDAPHHQVYQDQQKSTNRVEYQTSQKVVNQYQYQQEIPAQYQHSTVYQTSSYQTSPGYQTALRENIQSPGYQSTVSSYQQLPGQQSPTANYQSYQQLNQGYQSPSATSKQPVYQSSATYQPSSENSYQQAQRQQQSQQSNYQQNSYQQPQVNNYQQQNSYQQQSLQNNYQQQQASKQHQKTQQAPVKKVEFKIGPPPPPRGTSQDTSNMTAIYKQQYEQHLQKQYEQQQLLMNSLNDDDSSVPKAHIIKENIFEHNSTSGTPITYKAPPAAPPKPNWPPPAQQYDYRNPLNDSPTGMRVGSAWPPKRSAVTELPKTGFNPAAVRDQGTGRRCVWPPPADEMRSGCNTPQSPVTGRKIQWNPSPSPPLTRRTVFSPSHSPARRKDIQWPPPAVNGNGQDKENFPRASPRMSRKARFDDYIHEHASINVPQTYRPPPGTQHIEFR